MDQGWQTNLKVGHPSLIHGSRLGHQSMDQGIKVGHPTLIHFNAPPCRVEQRICVAAQSPCERGRAQPRPLRVEQRTDFAPPQPARAEQRTGLLSGRVVIVGWLLGGRSVGKRLWVGGWLVGWVVCWAVGHASIPCIPSINPSSNPSIRSINQSVNQPPGNQSISESINSLSHSISGSTNQSPTSPYWLNSTFY